MPATWPEAKASGSRPGLGQMPPVQEPSFWACVGTLDGAITRVIAFDVIMIGLAAVAWVLIYSRYPHIHLSVGPVEIAGGAMGVMLVFRSNVGYERWYEGRRLWGQITNSVCHLVVSGLAYGPADGAWRLAWTRWCCVFAHACRLSLRGQTKSEAISRLVGPEEAAKLAASAHMPSYVGKQLGALMRQYAADDAAEKAFLINLEFSRQQLTDAIGGCERISSTPLPLLYLLKIRRFIALYLLLLPAALVDRIGWASPLLTMLVAYPVLGLDRIASELQAPFRLERMNHLPLDAMCETIERRSMDIYEQDRR